MTPQTRLQRVAGVAKMVGGTLTVPFRADERRALPRPTRPSDYVLTELASSSHGVLAPASTIPVAHTPAGGYRKHFPAPVLADCDEPIAEGFADLRGVWEVYSGILVGHVERIEQAGDRIVITAGGVVHDMFADGTLEGGVNDISGPTGRTIRVAARFEEGRLNLYPGDRGVPFVSRWMDGTDLRWRYGPFRNRLRRLSGPPD